MKSRTLIAVLLGGVLMAVLAGCYGHSPVTDPQISFVLPDYPEAASTYVPEVPSNTFVVIKGKVEVPDGPEGFENVITKQEWTQVAANSGDPLGEFFITDSLETSWKAPEVTEPVRITLTFHVETSLGGQATKSLHLIVLPPVEEEPVLP